ncbi:MAG TPA: M14 family zinc carboxypeptidase [Candidatus Paceibacterota bacterium]|nr:M14 family zinc carboxypeptidase [Candidatus Paceibacterota bacterium]HRZ34452.1 M14 family zinc carboxypeptidase [Candidatus Paceibacterota bacterium]
MFSGRKKIWGVILLVAIVLCAAFVLISLYSGSSEPVYVPTESSTLTEPQEILIGKSVEGREINAYVFGTGKTPLLFIGGIHGGYEWNSVVLAYRFIDYFKQNPNTIPENFSVAVIPSANPDGVYKYIGKEGKFDLTDLPAEKNTTGLGRFNARGVDLNRNFDCRWSPEASWRNNKVGAGDFPFSEPESQAIRDFVLKIKPRAVVSWHSQANTIYAGECGNGILPETTDIMNIYSEKSGYLKSTTFDDYVVTGDLEGWLATINIPSITVELKTHETVEWEQNLAGVLGLFDYYSRAN